MFVTRLLFNAIARSTLLFLLLGPLIALPLYAGSNGWFYPQPLPPEWTLAPIMRQLGAAQTRAALIDSLTIALAVTFLALLIGIPAARTLGLRRFRGRGLVLLALFLPNVTPPLAIGMGLNILFLRLDLAGTLPGVMLVHLAPVLPYAIFALLGVFERYDEAYEQQASSLGASRSQVWLWVILPLIGPGVAVAALFAFLVSWSQYILTLLIGGGQIITLPILLVSSVSGSNPTSIAVIASLFAIPPLIAIALAARALSFGRAPVGQQY